MEQGHTTSVNRSERTVAHDPERTAVAPRFDDTEIERARPAVPLDDIGTRSRLARKPRPLLAAAVVAGLAGGVLGGVGTAVYQRRAAARVERAAQPASAASAPASSTATDDGARQQTGDSPSSGEIQTDAATAAPVADATESVGSDVPEKPSQQDVETEGTRADAGTEAELRGALDEWIAATNARDIDRQMSFYDSRLAAFYLARGASREAVRAEKRRAFERASAVSVRASGAQVSLGPDGRTAVMRFRKRYSIEGAGVERRGEVVQELRWRRTPQGWKIVSERDLRVLD